MKTLSLFFYMAVFLAATSLTPPAKLYFIGDSTASVYTATEFPRTGWAQVFQSFFLAESVKVEDKALSGRSSKSFFDEGAWAPVKSALRPGDFVFIQFGHNDEKTDDAARGTLPATTFKACLSVYIDDAIAKGAIPILLTPIERNSWKSDGKTLNATHITSDGDYPQAIRDLASARKLTLIDMTKLTKAYLEKVGPDSSTKLFMNLPAGKWPNYPNGNADNTHLQESGAKAIAKLAVDDILRQNITGLRNGIKGAPTALRATREIRVTPAPRTVQLAHDGVWIGLPGARWFQVNGQADDSRRRPFGMSPEK